MVNVSPSLSHSTDPISVAESSHQPQYSATIGKVTNGTFTAVGAPQSFYVVPLPAGK